MEYDRSKLNFTEKAERVWLNPETGNAFVSPEACLMHGDCEPQVLTLYRPTLAPIYGGPTLLEALWDEMDALVERLMSGATTDDVCQQNCNWEEHLRRNGKTDFAGCDHHDNGDRYRAEELAWVIAIVTNAYAPSMDLVRAEAMRRYRGEAE